MLRSDVEREFASRVPLPHVPQEIMMLSNFLAVSIAAGLTAAGVGLIFFSLRHPPAEEE